MTDSVTTTPAPMTEERLAEIMCDLERGATRGWVNEGDAAALADHIGALTARIVELEQREADALEEGNQLERRARRAESELAAARKPPEDGEVVEAVLILDAEYKGSHFGRACFAEHLMSLLTRLSAALKEAERQFKQIDTERAHWKEWSLGHEARANAAEAKLETAWRDALEAAALQQKDTA